MVFPAAALAGVFASLGALSASSLPTRCFRPLIMVLLISVALFGTPRPTFGAETGTGM